MEEPLIDYKIDYGEKGIRRNSEGEIFIESRVASPKLRKSLEKCLKYRRPDIFLIDEAHHFGIMSSGQKLKNQLECLKSLANMSSTNLALLGTYDLLTFRDLGGQLSRRTINIHFPRYKANNRQVLIAFLSVLKTFQKHLPLSQKPDLLSNWEYFYERSIGCIGILKDWLTRTLRDVLYKQIETVELKHFQARSLSINQCKQILKEIEEGEKALEETQKDRDELRSALGLTNVSQTQKPKKSNNKNNKVGQRKPTIENLQKICVKLDISLIDFLTKEKLIISNTIIQKVQQFKLSKGHSKSSHQKYCKEEIIFTLQQAIQEFPPPSTSEIVIRLSIPESSIRFHAQSLYSSVSLRHREYEKNKRNELTKTSLEEILNSEEYPFPSFKEVSTRLGISSINLRKNYPQLSRLIVEKYLQDRSKEAEKRTNKLAQEIRRIAIQLHNEGEEPLGYKISRRMDKPLTIIQNVALDALQEIRKELGYE